MNITTPRTAKKMPVSRKKGARDQVKNTKSILIICIFIVILE
jgi:hypothetical protein